MGSRTMMRTFLGRRWLRGCGIVCWLLLPLPGCAQRVRVQFHDSAQPVTLDLEAYVARVVAGEASELRSEAARRAMAIAARTFARVNTGRHRADGYDFCETTHCQDARRAAAPLAIQQSVEATEGETLWARGRLAEVFYTRNCGGRTEDAEALWPGAGRPWLRSLRDPSCPVAEWSVTLPLLRLSRILGLPELHQLRVAERTSSGRARVLMSDRGEIDAQALFFAVGRTSGWNLMRSNWYDVHVEGTRAVFHGRGYGHGVGLCQAGADARGNQGQSERQILAAYYPGTTAGETPEPVAWRRWSGERVEVQGALAGDAELVGLAEQALREAERRTGRGAGGRVRIRVYPTLNAYRDATGEPGFVAGSTRGRTIRLQPLTVLRGRDALQSTLLHEMLHVVLVPGSGIELPRWFEEGLALYFENPAHAKPGALQPATEQRLVHPASEQELRSAYANAKAAVAALIQREGREKTLERLVRKMPF